MSSVFRADDAERTRQNLALSLAHVKNGHLIESTSLQVQILEGYIELIDRAKELHRRFAIADSQKESARQELAEIKAKFDRVTSCR